jgi:hypothetical protein
MTETEARDFVCHFIADAQLWDEILMRLESDQTVGQAFINAGDRADQPYSWELYNTAWAVTEWVDLATIIKIYTN